MRQQLAGADDPDQRGPNLVAHAGQEFRAQARRFKRKVANLVARAIGLFFGALAAGDIHQHSFVVQNLAGRVVNRARTLLAPDDAAVRAAQLHRKVFDDSLSINDGLEPRALVRPQPYLREVQALGAAALRKSQHLDQRRIELEQVSFR